MDQRRTSFFMQELQQLRRIHEEESLFGPRRLWVRITARVNKDVRSARRQAIEYKYSFFKLGGRIFAGQLPTVLNYAKTNSSFSYYSHLSPFRATRSYRQASTSKACTSLPTQIVIKPEKHVLLAGPQHCSFFAETCGTDPTGDHEYVQGKIILAISA